VQHVRHGARILTDTAYRLYRTEGGNCDGDCDEDNDVDDDEVAGDVRSSCGDILLWQFTPKSTATALEWL